MVSFLKDLTFSPIFTTFPYLGTKNLVFLKLQSSHFGYLRLMKKNPSLSCFYKVGSESERELELGTKQLVYLKHQSSHFGLLMRKSPSLSCFCRRGSESERELDLEREILEFMKGSEKPGDFPTKAELVEAGRMDLVDGIVKRGGWLSMGWNLKEMGEENDEAGEIFGVMGNENGEMGEGNEIMGEENSSMGQQNGESAKENGEVGEGNEIMGGVVMDFDEGVETFESGDEKEKGKGNSEMSEESDMMGGVVRDFCVGVEDFEEDSYWVPTSFCQIPTSSGRSFEMGDKEEDSGVEGILARLEKQRNLSLGANLTRQPLSRYNSDDWLLEPSGDAEKKQRLLSGSSSKGIITNSGVNFSPSKSLSDFDGSLKPEMKLGPYSGFASQVLKSEYMDDTLNGGTVAITEGSFEVVEENGNDGHNDIRTRLQHLELELTSTLTSLRSKSEKLILEEGYGTSTDMQKLSDALEFQETEIMNAKDSLRSTRAKLAVLEGKMTLAIIGARKKIDEKQRKIDSAYRAIHLLRDASVVWPNSASEVFLVGSFDGWTTQRRMKKSSSGIFSLELKLYPGKYEIKFIVDGVWKTDPLRPIVKYNGYENNLFIVT